jgi:N-acetylglucosamine-6-phosphate deacetylase
MRLNGRIVTPRAILEGCLTIESGRIAAIGPRDAAAERDFGDALVVPGFIDVHMHGLVGFGIFDTEDLVEIAQMQCRFGTTGFLPTAASLDESRYIEFGHHVRRARELAGPDCAEIIGAHFEGPFVNPVAKGGMDETFLRPVDLDECGRYLDAVGPTLKLMTVAPELPGGEDLVRLLRRHGVVASIGHSRATEDQLHRAIDAGLSHVCHLFNTFQRDGRDPNWPWVQGLLDAVLADERLRCEVICDMVHVRPEHVRLAAERLGPDRFMAVTDSSRGAGLPPGQYNMLDGRPFTTQNGAARLVEGGTLVGSVLTMNQTFANLVQYGGIDPVRAAKYTSTNAARSLGMANEVGSIEVGRRANLAVLDDGYQCIATFVDGRLVYDNG